MEKWKGGTEMDYSPKAIIEKKIEEAKDKNLKQLDLSWEKPTYGDPKHRKLTDADIPDTISQLQNLVWLDLSGNQLTIIPDSITQLKNLDRLVLSDNKLIDVPDSITQLKNLTTLILRNNKLASIPHSIIQLPKLNSLNLRSNELSEVPDSIVELQNLTELLLSENNIKNIPVSICRLEKLTLLTLNGNPIETPPPEIASKGAEDIKNYLRQLEVEGMDHLFEAKLLIVGEAGAGKTTLVKKIEDPDYDLNKDEVSTEGIDIHRWSFPMTNGEPFWINFWDFGGQEIYHATHQFFLTKRSLYVLVADTRKEDTDFHYWLNLVELLSGSSPLLIVKNEKQNRHREINERKLRGRFTNLQKTLSTNLADGRGLGEVVNEITHYIQNLPHIGNALPNTWTKVRETLETLEKDGKNYINLDQYLNICGRHGIVEKEDKLQLMGYMHDLGICLHFQDDPLLKKTVILNPEWGTDAVYKVLDNRIVIQNLGMFTRADLSNIWSDNKFANMQDELLQLMLKFGLCYQIPKSGITNSNTFIAPQLLTENQPEYDWDEVDNLLLRYTYDFMPKGIITRFIVAMHHRISDQECVWKSGVVLEKEEQTKAEVIEYYETREIRIRISGKFKRDLLVEIMLKLDEIHDLFYQLKYNKLIPCICEECRSSHEPHFFRYEVLSKFMIIRKDIQCQKSGEMVNTRKLVDNTIGRELADKEDKGLSGDIIFEKPVERVIIQKAGSEGKSIEKRAVEKKEGQVEFTSAWANGLFYLFTFAFVLAGLGFLVRSIPWYTLPITLVSGILFVILIGTFQLHQDDRLTDKSFIELLKMVIKQLPLIGRLAKSDRQK
jgi:GTPase SAR1 family protein